MKINELRIGNWVKYDNLLCKVVEIYSEDIYCYDQFGEELHNIEYIQPIELTEEVLLKIEFKKFVKRFIMILNGYRIDYDIDKTLRIYKIHTDCCFVKDLEIKCEYVHELQNAYYCLTNEELEVEL